MQWNRTALLLINLLLVACSQAPDSATGGENALIHAATLEWSPEANCASCHIPQAESFNDERTLGFIHHQTAATCATCHTDEAMLKLVHEEMSPSAVLPSQLLLTKVNRNVCLTCHQSFQVLAERTSNFEGLIDQNGLIINPHALPKSQSYARITCANCHKMHQHGNAADAIDSAMYTCQSCHHAKVFTCSGCH